MKLNMFYPKLLFFRICTDHEKRTFNELLEQSDTFRNPGTLDNLLIESGLNPFSYCTHMSSKGKYPPDECAKELRQIQAGKLAFR